MHDHGPPGSLEEARHIVRTGPVLDRLRVFRRFGPLAWLLAVGNLVAVYWGWTEYYGGKFEVTPVALWVFVGDSPNAVFVFSLVLLMTQVGLRWAGLDLLAWVLNIKVGVWSAVVLLWWYAEFFSVDPGLRWLLFWLHIGMVAQAFVVHHELRTRPPSQTVFGTVAVLTLLDVTLDYSVRVTSGRNLHPELPGGPYTFQDPVSWMTVLVTLATLGLAWRLYVGPAFKASSSRGPVD